MTQATQILTLIALFGAFGVGSLYPEPQPEPGPPIFADNQDPDVPPPVCITECGWEGERWVCRTVCY